MTPFPWDTVLHAGLCQLRLPPEQFWAMTPLEFFAITGGLRVAATAIDRSGLARLMRQFPDAEQGRDWRPPDRGAA